MNTTDKKDLRYIAYARRSIESSEREKEKGVPSIKSQLSEIEKISNREQLKIVETITETKSAKVPGNREGFDRMLRMIRRGDADAIICFKSDRLARNYNEAGVLMQLLTDKKIRNITGSDFDWFDHENGLSWMVSLGMASEYSRDLSKHVSRGQVQACKRGYRPTMSPVGYVNSRYHPNEQKQQIHLVDEERFPIIRQCFDMILSRKYSPLETYKIATTELGLTSPPNRRHPNGRPLSQCTFYNMLNNTFYYGEFEYPSGSNNWYEGNHTPLITEDEFTQVQEILGKKVTRAKSYAHPYCALFKCGTCGMGVTCEKKHKKLKSGDTATYYYYHCIGRSKRVCSEPSIRQIDLEDQILELLSDLHINQDDHEDLLSQLKEESDEMNSSKEKVIQSYRQKLRACEGKLEGLMNLRMSNELTPQEYAKAKRKTEEEIKFWNDTIQKHEQKINNWYSDSLKFISFANKAVEEFENGGQRKRRTIIAELGDELILKDKQIMIELHEPLERLSSHGQSV